MEIFIGIYVYGLAVCLLASAIQQGWNPDRLISFIFWPLFIPALLLSRLLAK